MAQVDNPVKGFMFRISIPGINNWTVQKATTPDVDIDIVEHGDSGFTVKTAGMEKLGPIRVEKIIDQSFPDNTLWIWRKQVRNTQTGGGDIPANYKKVAIVEQLGADGISVIQRWVYTGVWPSKINGVELDRNTSSNTIHSFELCVDEEENS